MIQLYWKNATSQVVGEQHGLTEQDLAGIHDRLVQSHQNVLAQIQQGRLGYAALPTNTVYSKQVKDLADRYRGDTTDMIVLGIGGSALGNIALQSALNKSTWNLLSDRKRGGPRLFVLDNVDPALVGDTLELLGRRFGGRLTFFSPVDIQKTMVLGSTDEIRAYCRQMARHLGRPAGGFIPRWYSDPEGAGHRPEALAAMCEEFLVLSREPRPR